MDSLANRQTGNDGGVGGGSQSCTEISVVLQGWWRGLNMSMHQDAALRLTHNSVFLAFLESFTFSEKCEIVQKTSLQLLSTSAVFTLMLLTVLLCCCSHHIWRVCVKPAERVTEEERGAYEADSPHGQQYLV